MERWYSLQGLSAPQDPKATFQAKTWLLSAQYRHDSSQPWLKSQYTYHFKSTWVRHVCRHVRIAVHASAIYLFEIQSMQQVLCFQQHFVAWREDLPCISQKSPVYQKLLFYSMFFTIWKISFNNILNVDEGSQSENSYHIIFSLFEVVYKMPPLHIQTLESSHQMPFILRWTPRSRL